MNLLKNRITYIFDYLTDPYFPLKSEPFYKMPLVVIEAIYYSFKK